jgi:enoyl-CoA hydratase/carnithine racemase
MALPSTILRSSLWGRAFSASSRRLLCASAANPARSYENILVETQQNVGVIRLNRPKALNALNSALFEELLDATRAFDLDDAIGCMVLTSTSDKAFAAGADISEMSSKTFDEAYKTNMFRGWNDLTRLSKPLIAAVNGFALGGGCELAMMCDFILAGRNAKFGQPEINLGVIPGAGGTQRLTRAVGKSKAMMMALTGEMMSAEEAERAGLVARVYESDVLVDEAIKMAQKIAGKGRMSVCMAKEAVNASEELSLQEGLRLERRLFHALFSTEDQKEGMKAFLEKREPRFTHK